MHPEYWEVTLFVVKVRESWPASPSMTSALSIQGNRKNAFLIMEGQPIRDSEDRMLKVSDNP